MKQAFAKYEGLGNDFLLVERSDGAGLDTTTVRAWCDRHRGVGGDGVLLTGRDPQGPFMRVVNADGSRPEMCGNGLRCVALYWAHRGGCDDGPFSVQTDAGPHRVRVIEPGARRSLVEVELPAASLEADRVLRDASGTFVRRPFVVEDRALEMTSVSMGNPHLVTFDPVDPAERAVLGGRIERDPRLKAGANVSFASHTSDTVIQLVVWERGVGFTQACGTAACATAVAAVEMGRSPRDANIEVRLPGGSLTIRVGQRGAPITMVGPARHVFDGEIVAEEIA